MTDEETPRIIFAGKEYAIPELAIFQLKKCRRKIIDLNNAIFVVGPDGKNDGKYWENFGALSDEQVSDLHEVIYQGLLGASPKLSRDDYDALRPRDQELLPAFIVIRRQSNLFIFKPDSESDTERQSAGEATAPATTGA